jgi:predicted Rossmann fold flavoprotein
MTEPRSGADRAEARSGDDPASPRADSVDVLVVGAGAAGLAAAIFAARSAPSLRVRCLDGARRVGAKILVSGGSRCNVTNRVVSERDFWGGSSAIVKRVLRAFPPEKAAAFFAEIGVGLHEEEDGKLFPDSDRARTVLDALLAALAHSGATLGVSERVTDVCRNGRAFVVRTDASRSYHAQRVVLATGGRSLPKTGSDGFGYELARRLGHGYVETSPALAPLLLGGTAHHGLAGVAHPASLTLRAGSAKRVALTGPMLWTHFGVSGPVALNMSRHWHRARLEGQSPVVTLSLCPGDTFETLEEWLLDRQAKRPRAQVHTVLAERLPAAVADVWAGQASVERDATLAHLARVNRRRLIQALLETTLDVVDSRGYTYAEVTAGGVPLEEIDPATLESRICPGLYLVGEMLDVDGRLGGFNFQWAWSSGWVAGHAVALSSDP